VVPNLLQIYLWQYFLTRHQKLGRLGVPFHLVGLPTRLFVFDGDILADRAAGGCFIKDFVGGALLSLGRVYVHGSRLCPFIFNQEGICLL